MFLQSLRNRFLLTVICYPIYHWLEVSVEVDTSRVQSATDIFSDDWAEWHIEFTLSVCVCLDVFSFVCSKIVSGP